MLQPFLIYTRLKKLASREKNIFSGYKTLAEVFFKQLFGFCSKSIGISEPGLRIERGSKYFCDTLGI